MSKAMKDGRKSLEEKTKNLEEKARLEKLTIDKKLALEILEEENRTHNETIKELEQTIEQENHAHDNAVKELEDKIANLEQQTKTQSSPEELPSSQTTPEPTQAIPETTEELSDDTAESISLGTLQEPRQEEVEVPKEGSKKKKRGFL